MEVEIYWTCSDCGSANLYPYITECEVCGKTIDDVEVANAKESIKNIENRIAEEKRREKENEEKRRKEKEEKERLIEAERKAVARQEKKEKVKKAKTKMIHAWWIAEEYLGIAISAIIVLVIIVNTIIMSSTTGVTAGWVFFIILAVASIVLSGFCYMFFNDDLSIGFTNIVPSGLIGAFAIACTVSDLWVEMVVDTFKEGFLVILFAGLISLIIFAVIAIIAVAIIIAVTHVLTAFLQTVIDDIKGGLVGLLISVIAAFLYLTLVESSGLSIVLGR